MDEGVGLLIWTNATDLDLDPLMHLHSVSQLGVGWSKVASAGNTYLSSVWYSSVFMPSLTLPLASPGLFSWKTRNWLAFLSLELVKTSSIQLAKASHKTSSSTRIQGVEKCTLRLMRGAANSHYKEHGYDETVNWGCQCHQFCIPYL